MSIRSPSWCCRGTGRVQLEDYWRVMGDSAQHEAQGGAVDEDRILSAPVDDFAPGPADDEQPPAVDDDPDDSAYVGWRDAAQLAAEQRTGSLVFSLLSTRALATVMMSRNEMFSLSNRRYTMCCWV